MKRLLIFTTAALVSVGAHAQVAFNASLTPDIAIYPRTTEVSGLCLSVWGENLQHSLTLGLVNGSTGDSSGFTWGIVNYADSYKGVTWGIVNITKSDFIGWQSGWVNIAQGKFIGFQSARIFNYANEFYGLQLGLVNYTENLRGVQLGLANIAMNNPWFTDFPDKLATGFPLVNWSF